MVVTFHGSKNRLLHPDRSRELVAGESFEAPELWVRQHQPYVLSGELTIDAEDDAPKKKTKKTT